MRPCFRAFDALKLTMSSASPIAQAFAPDNRLHQPHGVRATGWISLSACQQNRVQARCPIRTVRSATQELKSGAGQLGELTPNFGDGRDQAAAWACDLTTSIPSVNFIPRMTFGNWL
jgi:hypothetical protein